MLIDSLEYIRAEVLIFACCVFIFYLFNASKRERSKFPPGPRGWPFVGSLPYLLKNPHLKLIELSKTYGDVFSIKIGSQRGVVLTSEKAIREAFTKTKLLERPPNNGISVMGERSPFFTHGIDLWQTHRRFTMKSIREFKLGESNFEECVQEEINQFLGLLKNYHGSPIDFESLVIPSLSNNISFLLLGKRYHYRDPKLIELVAVVQGIFKIISNTAAHIAFPWIKYVSFIQKWLNGGNDVIIAESMREFFKSEVQEHKKTFNPESAHGFIDSYLGTIRCQEENDSTYSTFTEDNLVSCLIDLFAAGSESVKYGITWSMYAVALYPDLKRKILKEIKDVMGTKRKPSFSDRKLMPYSYAFIQEVLRWKTPFPFAPFRYAVEDTTIKGYEIPRGTIVAANLWSVNHNPEIWKDPDAFKPERFLGADGMSGKIPSAYFTFSVGKRRCPAATLANTQTFLYLVSILQAFDVQMPKNMKLSYVASMDLPQNFKICMIQWKENEF